MGQLSALVIDFYHLGPQVPVGVAILSLPSNRQMYIVYVKTEA